MNNLTLWSFVIASQKRNPYRKGAETDRRHCYRLLPVWRPHCCGGLNEEKVMALQMSGNKQLSQRENHWGICPTPCSPAVSSQSHCRGLRMLTHVSRLHTGGPSAWAPTTLHPQRHMVCCLFLESFPNTFISSKMFADIYSVPTFPKWWNPDRLVLSSWYYFSVWVPWFYV